PALDGSLVDLLAHLPSASGRDGTLILVELERLRVPWQPKKFHHPARPFLLIRNQFGVRNLQKHVSWQNTAPVIHKTTVLPVVVRQVGEVHRKIERGLQLLQITGQAGIDRVTLQVDDARLREYRVN